MPARVRLCVLLNFLGLILLTDGVKILAAIHLRSPVALRTQPTHVSTLTI